MKVLYVEPMKKPKIIDTTLETEEIYRLLNTDIYERCWFFEDDVCLLCDECGWLHDYQLLNRHIRQTIIKGPFILCCEEHGDYTSLKDEYMTKYQKMFERPETFLRIGDHVYYSYLEENEDA